jgi:hypothetical protein
MYKHWCPGTGGLCREKEYVDETCTDSLVRGPATNTLRISAIKRKISRGDEARNKRSEGGEILFGWVSEAKFPVVRNAAPNPKERPISWKLARRNP